MTIETISWLDLLGYLSSLLVVLSSCMTTMIPLRLISILSSIVFIAYAFLIKDYPLFILNLLLLPINTYKLIQIKSIERKVQKASSSDPAFSKLLPIMHKRVLRQGEVLFHEGDEADRLYYIQSGVLKIEHLDLETSAGHVLGEIGMFTIEHKRIATVYAKTDSIIYELTEDQVKQAYFLDPSLSFSILFLITQRLIENERRLKKIINQDLI